MTELTQMYKADDLDSWKTKEDILMDDLAKEYDGKVKIYKVDTDKEKRLAGVFQIRSIPAVLFSPMEGRPMIQAGALPKDQYIKIIEEELLKNIETK